jgi:hypothetical protein
VAAQLVAPCVVLRLDSISIEECRVALARTDVSREHSASIIRVTRIDEMFLVHRFVSP